MNKYIAGPWLVVLAALLWATDAPFRKFLTDDLSSTTIVFMEHIFVVVLVFAFLSRYLKELKNLGFREWLAVIFIGIGGSALATVLFTQSFHYLNPSVVILLQKIQPFIAIGLAALVLRESLTPKFWLWAVIGIFGGYLIAFPEFKISGLTLEGKTLGIIYAILAAFFWGGSTVFGRFLLRKVSFQAVTAIRFLAAFVFLLGLGLYKGVLLEVSSASGTDWFYVFIIAVLAGFVSLFIYYRGLKYTKASVATIGELVFPFSAVIVNWIFLDATLNITQIVGGAILIFAIYRLSLINTK